MDGYNGTIFCYGQTGSGKTFTMSGSGIDQILILDSWQERGIIPRVLQYIFDEIDKRKKEGKVEYNVSLTFMEIYNEHAYDLLERKHLELDLEKWNKIHLSYDEKGELRIKNITVH